jgi:hypothetical protein
LRSISAHADRADRAHQLGGPIGRQASGRAARDQVAQGGMKSAGRLGAETGEVVVAIHQDPDHRCVVIDADRSQPAMAQPSGRRRQHIVGAVLGSFGRAEQADPR